MLSDFTQSNTTLVLIAHAPLASAFKACALHILPEQSNQLIAYDVIAQNTPEQGLQDCLDLLKKVKSQRVLIMTDIVGATPYHISESLLNKLSDTSIEAHLISGANIPMVLRALTYSQKPMDELVALAIAGAMKGLVHVNPLKTVTFADSMIQNSPINNI